jgi:hypothetical protein
MKELFEQILKRVQPDDSVARIKDVFWFHGSNEGTLTMEYDDDSEREFHISLDGRQLVVNPSFTIVCEVDTSEVFYGDRGDVYVDFDIYDHVDPTDDIWSALSQRYPNLTKKIYLTEDEFAALS